MAKKRLNLYPQHSLSQFCTPFKLNSPGHLSSMCSRPLEKKGKKQTESFDSSGLERRLSLSCWDRGEYLFASVSLS